MSIVRPAAVAGRFYSADSHSLRQVVEEYLQQGRLVHPPSKTPPKAIIVPHAGYEFSGPVAGTAYAQLDGGCGVIERVVLIGPAHYVGFQGLAVCDADYFSSPLGAVPVDTASVARLLELDQVVSLNAAHAPEHSLEVQIPFLQVELGEFSLVPIAVGQAADEEVVEVLDLLWGGAETLLVVSSDLSHYHDYATAQRIDRQTTRLIETLSSDDITGGRACGHAGISALLRIAKRRRLNVRAIDLRNSGDTAGPRDQVVGYGAYIIE